MHFYAMSVICVLCRNIANVTVQISGLSNAFARIYVDRTPSITDRGEKP